MANKTPIRFLKVQSIDTQPPARQREARAMARKVMAGALLLAASILFLWQVGGAPAAWGRHGALGEHYFNVLVNTDPITWKCSRCGQFCVDELATEESQHDESLQRMKREAFKSCPLPPGFIAPGSVLN